MSAQSTTNVWPGAFGIYKDSAAAVKLNIGPILLIIGLNILLSLALGSITGKRDSNMNPLQLVSDLVSVWFAAAMTITILASVRGKKVLLGESLKKAWDVYFNYLILSVLTILALGVSLLLLVVPFFFVLPRLVLAPYYLVDKNLGPIEALKASWNNSQGHSAKAWGIIGASILMALLIIVLVGIYFLVMYSAAFAVLYLFVNKSAKKASSRF